MNNSEANINSSESENKITLPLPKLQNVSRRENEKWEIKALPSEWTPVYSKSNVLETLTRKREIEHNKCLSDLDSKMAEVNAKIENRIRLKSKWIKEEYQYVQKQAEIKMTGKLKGDNTRLSRFKMEDFENISKSIQEIHEHYLDEIKELYGYFLQLERTRCYHFKIILRDSFETLHKVAFKLPRELQELFEHKILNTNQITLSNLRSYHDICATLQLQGENSIRRWLQALTSLKDKWKSTQKEQATQKLIDFRLTSDPDLLQKEVSRNVNIQFDVRQREGTFTSSLTQLMMVPLHTRDVNEWCDQVENEIKELGHVTKTLVNLYRGAIVQVFNGYMEEFQNISERMIDCGVVDESELEQFNKDVAVPIIDEISTQLSSKITDIKHLWEDVSAKLEKQTRTTVSFLRGAAIIWEKHFERLDILKNTVLKELDQVIAINNKLCEKKEANICISIDRMRQESTKTNLNKELANLNKLLDELQEVYVDDCQKELEVLQKYPGLAQEETELLMKQLRQFLNAYPKKIGEIRRASRCTIPEEPDLVLPAQMKMCEYEVQALDNWILGLWEAIDKYLLTCNTELAEKAEEWKTTHVKRVLKRLEVKIAFHKARYDRTRINIYDTRLAELEAHNERLERHKTEIGIQMQEMCTITATFGNKLQMILEKQFEDLELRILRKVEMAKNSEVASAIAFEVEVTFRRLQTQAEDVIKEYAEIIEAKNNKIFESNHECRKSIKFFSEDGNFSQDEAKRYFSELRKLEATLVKKAQALQKDIDTKYLKLNNTIQQKCLTLSVMLKQFREELEFREQIIKDIRKVQSDIKICIYDKKYTLKRFSAEIRRLKHPVFADVENLKRFKTNFTDLVGRILGFEMYLIKKEMDVLEPVSSLTSSGRNISKRQSIASKSSRASRGSRVSTARSRLSSIASSAGTQYTSQVFRVRPPDTCTFMTELNSALYESMDTIQRMAKRFYRKDRVVRNTDMLQPTLGMFMDEIIRKYKRYITQVEMAWMDIVNETLKLLKQLLHFIWKQYEIILQNYYESEVKEANKEKNEKIRTIETVKETYEKANENLHARLKVHYAYVNNKLLLDFLLKEADKLKHKLKIHEVYEWFNSYEGLQRNARIEFLKKLDNIEDELQTLKNVGFSLVNEKLIEQFEENLQPKRKSESPIRKDKVSMSWTTVSEVSLRYENLKSQSKVSVENKSSTTVKNTLVSSTSFLAQNVPKNSLMDIDEEIIYEETVTKDNLIKSYDDEIGKRAEMVKEVQKNFDLMMEKWVKIWITSKDKILKMYTVKYNNA